MNFEIAKVGDIVINLEYTNLYLVYRWCDPYLGLVGCAMYVERSRFRAWVASIVKQSCTEPYWVELIEGWTRQELIPAFRNMKSTVVEEEHARYVYLGSKIRLTDTIELENELQQKSCGSSWHHHLWTAENPRETQHLGFSYTA